MSQHPVLPDLIVMEADTDGGFSPPLHYEPDHVGFKKVTFSSRTLGLSFTVLPGGFVEEVVHAFGLGRLRGLRQFALQQFPLTLRPHDSWPEVPYRHNRYEHSLIVAAVAAKMAYGRVRDLREFKLLIMAALTHDAATAAGSDSTKLIGAFDEVDHFVSFKERPEVQVLLLRHGITFDELLLTVNEQGRLGSILCAADRIGYLSWDVDSMISCPAHAWGDVAKRTIMKLKGAYGHALKMWQRPRVTDGRVAFDVETLEAFLRLRAGMCRYAYWTPDSRTPAWVIRIAAMRYLYKSGFITEGKLLKSTDEDVEGMVAKFLSPALSRTSFVRGDVTCEGFNDQFSAERRVQQVVEAGNPFVVLERASAAITSGTTMFGYTEHEMDSFAVLNPKAAREITAEALFHPQFRVFTLRNGLVSHENVMDMVHAELGRQEAAK